MTISHLKKGSISLRCALLNIARSTYYEYESRVVARHARDRVVVDELRALATAKKFKTLTMAYIRAHQKTINHKKWLV